MVLMTEEGWKAMDKINNYSWEINLCMREQGFMHENMTDEEIGISLDAFTEIMGEYSEET